MNTQENIGRKNIWQIVAFILIGMIIGYIVGRFELGNVDIKTDTTTTNSNTNTQQETNTNTQPSNSEPVEISVDDDPALGVDSAPITIVEFSDYQCPVCKRFTQNYMEDLKKDYIDTGKVKYVFRDFPLTMHKAAVPIHVAVECAGEQGKYWELHDIVFENQALLNSSSDLNGDLTAYAEELGLNTTTFSTCLDSQEVLDEIMADKEDGKSYGVSGTPTLFINGQKVKGMPRSYEVLSSILDGFLES